MKENVFQRFFFMPKKRDKSTQEAWRSIQEVCLSKDAGKHKKCMALILRLLPQMPQSEWERRCRQLYRTHSVEGPEAVAWGLKLMATIHPPGKDRITILEQMDQARNDAAIMRKIQKGWQQYGFEDPWWVVHHKPEKQLPRYHSEPILKPSSF